MKKTLGALALGAALTLSACGGSGGDESGGGDTLKLALVASLESPTTSLPMIEPSVKSAVAAINADGGVNGKKIELSVCNDKANAEDLRRCVQDAIRDGALGVVGLLTPHGATAWPLLESAGLPALAPGALQKADAQSPMSFPIDPGAVGLVGFPGAAQRVLKADDMVPVHLDEAFAAPNQSYYEMGAKLSGLTLEEAINIPTDAVDYGPYVSRAEKSGAQLVLGGLTTATQLKWWKAVDEAGSDLKTVVSGGTVTPASLKEAGEAANGSIIIAGTPAAAKDNPTGAQFVAEMDEFEKGEVQTTVGMRAWAGVHLFAKAAESIDGDVTRESLVKALNASSGEFLWIKDLQWKTDGPVDDLPRLTNWELYPSLVENSVPVPQDAFDPFAS
ncbi:ABC transporter substrate-binding protein [Pseudonocardia xishanensis]|uniref:Leucine-binding protein domain-containing protein n=1 Tax=Pseudonocardia xishanensis TaxID=630995 RepID=A0ABP8RP53_9PSEU